jgi:hypothetical protein
MYPDGPTTFIMPAIVNPIEDLAMSIHFSYPHDCGETDSCRIRAQQIWNGGYRPQ